MPFYSTLSLCLLSCYLCTYRICIQMTALATKLQKKMPQTVDVGEEAKKLAEDVKWGSRQIRRLLGLGSRSEQDVATPHSEVQVSEIPSQNANDASENVCDPVSTFPQGKLRGKKRQWVSNTFQSLMGSVGGSAAGGAGAIKVATAVGVSVKGGGNRETAQELERLLGEVSSNEGRLDNLLDLSSSIPDNTDGEGCVARVHRMTRGTHVDMFLFVGSSSSLIPPPPLWRNMDTKDPSTRVCNVSFCVEVGSSKTLIAPYCPVVRGLRLQKIAHGIARDRFCSRRFFE